jgi:hypothetical protein
VEADGQLQLEDIEWARPVPTGDAAAVDAAVAADRAWFIGNPSATCYIRCALPGEWSTKRVGEPPAPGAALVVEVRQLAPGLYSRKPVYWALPDDSANDQSSAPEPPRRGERMNPGPSKSPSPLRPPSAPLGVPRRAHRAELQAGGRAR